MNDTITGFSFEINELSDSAITQIQNNIAILSKEIGKPGLEMPLINLTTELLRYAITNNFLAIQENYIDLFDENEETMGLAKKARKIKSKKSSGKDGSEIGDLIREISIEKGLLIGIKVYMREGHIFLTVSHFGKIGSIEQNYIKKTMQKVEDTLEQLEAHKLKRRETISKKITTGLELALLSMHGMGIPKENFETATKSGKTYYRVNIPHYLLSRETTQKSINDNNELKTNLYSMFTSLQYTLIEFDQSANVISILGSIFELLHIKDEDHEILKEMIPARFFEDIFWGPFSVKNMKIFENYRLRIESFDNEFRCLFNISGTNSGGGHIKTLWQAVNISSKDTGLSEGGAFDNVHIMNMVRPYIPEMILEKAKECVRKGLTNLPNERKDVTIFFADLISFTQKSEVLPHEEVISLLNLTMSTIVQSIERYKGSIDKFIGDGIMCVFDEPLNAVIAATEIQNNLFNLNQFRRIGGQAPLELRIGINSGPVILGSVGTKHRMDWTALGDIVNTASRIEKHSMKYSVLLGEKTYKKVVEQVSIAELIKRNFKGKANIHTLFFIESVTFEHEGKNITLHVPTNQSIEV